MMTTRRYGDDEVREIFALATTGETREHSLPVESGGMTLDDIQRIGREAGIEPVRVAEAAQLAAARGTPAPVQRFLGLPIGLSRVVDLPRAPTDREWEQLRLTSRSEAAVALNGLGIIPGGMSVLMTAVGIAAGKPEKALAVLAMLGGISLAAALGMPEPDFPFRGGTAHRLRNTPFCSAAARLLPIRGVEC